MIVLLPTNSTVPFLTNAKSECLKNKNKNKIFLRKYLGNFMGGNKHFTVIITVLKTLLVLKVTILK